jgi:YD repeat-containing protein
MVDRKRFAEKLCELCYAGDVQAMRLLLSYTDGLPVGRAEVVDPQGFQITVTYVQQNNRIELTSASSGASQTDPGGEAL